MSRKNLFLVAFLNISFNVSALVNINTATQEELETLENVGPVKADSIIKYRIKNGGFKHVSELKNAPGISDETLKKNKNNISLSGDTKPQKYHEIVRGDTLIKIAQFYYGNVNQYFNIFEVNKSILKHPDKIYPGQKLLIP